MSTSTSIISDGDFLNDNSVELNNETEPPTTTTTTTTTTAPTETAHKLPSSAVPIMVEKKRDREKKRRTDITNAIDALVKLLVTIDPSLLMVRNNQVFGIISSSGSLLPMNDPSLFHLQSESNSSAADQAKETEAFIGMKRRYRTSLVGDPVPLNRTDIIHHAARILDKIHRENEEHRKEIQQLKFLIAQHQQSAISNYNSVTVPSWPFLFWNPSSMTNGTDSNSATVHPSVQDHQASAAFPTANVLHSDGNSSLNQPQAQQAQSSSVNEPTVSSSSASSAAASSQPIHSSSLQAKTMAHSHSSNQNTVVPSPHVFDLQQQLLLAQQQYQLQAMYQQQVLLYQQQQQQQQQQNSTSANTPEEFHFPEKNNLKDSKNP